METTSYGGSVVNEYLTGALIPKESIPFDMNLNILVKYTGNIDYYNKDFSSGEKASQSFQSFAFAGISKKEEPILSLYGEVEEIEDELALVVIEKDKNFEERLFSVERLKKINADFIGAKIRIIISEEGNSVTTKIEKFNDDNPIWANPDEDLIHLIQQIKNKSV
jgi:hypothetical protein